MRTVHLNVNTGSASPTDPTQVNDAYDSFANLIAGESAVADDITIIAAAGTLGQLSIPTSTSWLSLKVEGPRTDLSAPNPANHAIITAVGGYLAPVYNQGSFDVTLEGCDYHCVRDATSVWQSIFYARYGNIFASRGIAYATGSHDATGGIRATQREGTFGVWTSNLVFANIDRGDGAEYYGCRAVGNHYNTVFYNCGSGLDLESGHVITNCITFDNAGAYGDFRYDGFGTIDYCVTTETLSGNNANGIVETDANIRAYFTDPANLDFTLTAAGITALAGVGATDPASGDGSYAFSDDISGAARSGAWSIGPEQLVVLPVISSPTVLAVADNVDWTASSDTVAGTLYAVIDTAGNMAGITEAQIKAGTNNADAAAVAAASGAVAASPQTITDAIVTLTPGTSYDYAIVQETVDGYSNVLTGTIVVQGLVIGAITNPMTSNGTATIPVTDAGTTQGTVTMTDAYGTAVACTITAWPTGTGDGNITINVPEIFANNLFPGTVTILVQNAALDDSDSVNVTLNMETNWANVEVASQNTGADEYLIAQDGGANPVAIVAGDFIGYEDKFRLESNDALTAYDLVVNDDCTYQTAEIVPENAYYITYRIYDISDNTWGNSAQRIVNIVSSAPQYSGPILAPVARIGVPYTFNLAQYFAHPSGKSMSYAFGNLPSGITQNISTPAIIDGTPDTVQTNIVTVTVTDTDGASSGPHSFSLRVNQAPQWSAIPAQSHKVGDVISLDLAAYATDVDALSFSVNTLPNGLSLTGSVISGTLGAVQSLSTNAVADDGDLTSQISISWTITARPVLDSNIPAQNLRIGDNVSINLNDYFSDADGDALTFSSTQLPAGLSLDGSTGMLTGTVTTFGTTSVTFTATDGETPVDSNAVSFSVNDAPVFSGPIADRYTVVGDSALLNLSQYFSDANTLFYQVVSGTLPAGLSLNATTGVVSGNPSAEGSATLVFSATDGTETTNTNSITWVTNQAPVETSPIPAQTPTVGDAVSINLNDYVSEFFPMTFAASNLPSGLSLDASTGLVTGNVSAIGSYTVQFTANDGYLTTNLTPVSFVVSAGLGVNFASLTDGRNSPAHPSNPSQIRANETGVKIWVLKNGTLLSYGDDYTTDSNGLPPPIEISGETEGTAVTAIVQFSNGDGSPPIGATIGSLA